MSTLLRSLCRNSALVVLCVGAAARAHAQVLREVRVGVLTGDTFGYDAANAGDVDGDGTDDFIVGSPFYDSGALSSSGRVVVYSGATGVMMRSHDGLSAFDELGVSVAGAGDVNNDGFADYVVGAPNHSTSLAHAGLAVCYSGKSGGTIWTKVGTTANATLGYSVSGIGDVDGDGRSDVIVGTSNQEIFVLDDGGNTIHHVTGGNDFGITVSGCGDLDGDGVKDFLVAEPSYDRTFPFKLNIGAVRIYSGAGGNLIRSIYGTNSGDYLGFALAALGDIDQDGVDDFAAGSFVSDANGSGSGIVRVVSGATGATIREQAGDAAGELHGRSIAGMGDVDRDGVPDYAVGAVNAGSGAEGRVRICSGSDGTTIYEWYGSATSNRELGSSLASGDWNGDGVADLVLGDAGGDSRGAPQTGSAYVYLMAPAWRANYGTGWAGKHGVPTLTTAQNPEVGSPLDLKFGNTLGATTTGLLFVGLQPASVPIPGSGTILVAPFFSVILSLPATGLTLSSALPNDPHLYFFDLYLQAIELDPFATKGLSFTPGLQLHCGFDLP